MTNKIRLLDSDVISNILKTVSESGIKFNFINNHHIKFITTSLVVKEVEIYLRELEYYEKNDEIISYNKALWKSIKDISQIKEIKTPSTLKNMGERSLIETIPELKTTNYKVVSNNKKDVMHFFKANKINEEKYEYPFEFYEEMNQYWFDNNYKEMIKFMIISNRDFKILKKSNLGNILKTV
ncbi:hypothetical protein [Ferroplasma acidiphilum]|jgi:hypothetical protein|uniref:hypothetical protein n=1 Tax=Ferroplasma acidiphilum TaxID=74969 RepID=UPI002815A25F|nr:hypothetical protein [Ferroplasma acidiphilum]WMT53775.1 MAG: hypothetical protein RE473_02750 [Ferroplasma acidiphilum]